MIKRITCADCEHHECTTVCVLKDSNKKCNGKCTKKNKKMSCQRIKCNEIKMIDWVKKNRMELIMVKEYIYLLTGVVLGALVVLSLHCLDAQKQNIGVKEIKDTLNSPPKELPAEVMEFEKVKLPENLTEVIL